MIVSPARRLALVSLLVIATACAGSTNSATSDSAAATPSVRAADPAADEAAMRATLDGWYAAMQSLDSAGVMAPLTSQFLLLEDTLPLSGAELFARLKEGGTTTKWTAAFSDWRTRVLGDVAWTTLKNHEESTAPDGKKCQADFLETIVFVRDGEHWRIDRYHAAALHRWSCGA